jgi:hypothetical protein
MVFTIVTIIFLPLSFIASFFAINITEFPGNGTTASLPLGYVSKYTFGIGFAISIPLIVMALILDDIGAFFREARRWLDARRQQRKDVEADDGRGLDVLRIQPVLSTSRSARKSVETEWMNHGRLSRETGRTATRREKVTGFRMMVNGDVV